MIARVLGVVLAATLTSAGATRADRAVPFRVGETLTYDVAWSPFVTAGAVTTTVRDQRPSFGRTAYYIVAEGEPTSFVARLYPAYYKVDTLVETSSLLPQRGSVFSEEAGRRRLKETRFNHGARKATYEVRTSTVTSTELRLVGPTHDALSALYALRAASLAPERSMRLYVTDSGELYDVAIRVVGREAVTSGLGSRSAWKLEPVVRNLKGQPVGWAMALWLSDDAQRLPLKLQAKLPVGDFVLTLRSADGHR